MVILDANMILRYLLNDNVQMAEQAERYLEEDTAFVTIEVIAEVVYVLKGVYDLERREISGILTDFMNMAQSRDRTVLKRAIETYGAENLDFVDCVLYAYHSVQGIDIATFDKKLLKLLRRG